MYKDNGVNKKEIDYENEQLKCENEKMKVQLEAIKRQKKDLQKMVEKNKEEITWLTQKVDQEIYIANRDGHRIQANTHRVKE